MILAIRENDNKVESIWDTKSSDQTKTNNDIKIGLEVHHDIKLPVKDMPQLLFLLGNENNYRTSISIKFAICSGAPGLVGGFPWYLLCKGRYEDLG